MGDDEAPPRKPTRWQSASWATLLVIAATTALAVSELLLPPLLNGLEDRKYGAPGESVPWFSSLSFSARVELIDDGWSLVVWLPRVALVLLVLALLVRLWGRRVGSRSAP